MPRFTLRQMEALLSIAETGSIAQAARELGLSASAVTGALNELERALDSTLTVRRKAHGVTLTPTGIHVVEEARTLLSLSEEIEHSTRGSEGEVRGRLSIGSYVSLGPTVLTPLLAEVARRHPGIEVDFATGSQEHMCQRVLSGDLDVAVAYDLNLPAGLRTIPLGRFTPHAVLPAGHRLTEQATVSLRQLASEPMILLDISPSRENTFLLFTAEGLTPAIAYRTTDFEVSRSMVGAGLGYAILTQRPSGDRTYTGQPLEIRRLHPRVRSLDVVLVCNARTRLSRPAAVMMEIARALPPDVLYPSDP
ncbi:MAG: LysR substrate-binding domain-containing protein [Micrococcaceae bacterium]